MAFEIGARDMGADISFVPGELGVNEPLEDIGPYLANWFDLLIVRAARHEDLVHIAESSHLPLINARSDRNHPCEIMGDLQYIRRKRGSIEGLRVIFVGELTNLCMSWFAAANRFPIEVIQVAPAEYHAPQELLSSLNDHAAGSVTTADSLAAAVENADVIYTDCWPKKGNRDGVKSAFLPYRVDVPHLERMNQNGFFLPCPPVTRGEEVSTGAMTHPRCRNYEAKAFLLHAQNAIMEYVTGAD
jgi:ornithine carbamoyltransferase